MLNFEVILSAFLGTFLGSAIVAGYVVREARKKFEDMNPFGGLPNE